jgi:cytidyltransferase-like protein
MNAGVAYAHAGHVSILERAKQAGDFLLVGLHTDDAITEARGRHHPIQTLHERALSVLACRYVDEVVMGTPQTLTKDLLTTFNIGLVVQGSVHGAAPRPTPHRLLHLCVSHCVSLTVSRTASLAVSLAVPSRTSSSSDSFAQRSSPRSLPVPTRWSAPL